MRITFGSRGVIWQNVACLKQDQSSVNQSKSCGANGCDQTECCVADATCGDVDGGGETIITCYAKTKHLVSSPSIDWQQQHITSLIDQKFDDFLFLIVVVFLTGKQKYTNMMLQATPTS